MRGSALKATRPTSRHASPSFCKLVFYRKSFTRARTTVNLKHESDRALAARRAGKRHHGPALRRRELVRALVASVDHLIWAAALVSAWIFLCLVWFEPTMAYLQECAAFTAPMFLFGGLVDYGIDATNLTYVSLRVTMVSIGILQSFVFDFLFFRRSARPALRTALISWFDGFDATASTSLCATPHAADSHLVLSNATSRITVQPTHQPRSWSKASASGPSRVRSGTLAHLGREPPRDLPFGTRTPGET